MKDDDCLVAASPKESFALSDNAEMVGTQASFSRFIPGHGCPTLQQRQTIPTGSWTSGNFAIPSLFSSPFGSSSNLNQSQGNQDRIDEGMDEVIDFTFVQETDVDEVDILLAADDPHTGQIETVKPPLDPLAVLISGSTTTESEELVSLSEEATSLMNKAVEFKRRGQLKEAVDTHNASARLFHTAAVVLRDQNSAMAKSFLLLSQTEAKSALGLKRVMKLRPNSAVGAQKDHIVETVRGALNSEPQADLSESVFLGTAKGGLASSPVVQQQDARKSNQQPKSDSNSSCLKSNPIDEMMRLERELRDVDLALEMGNSFASIETKSRMKNMDGSFMVVSPGSNSYMSNSMILNHATQNTQARTTPISSRGAGVRARTNRVHSVGAARSSPVVSVAPAQRSSNPNNTTNQTNGLESSWWGGNSTAASQVLTNSVISLASTHGGQMLGLDQTLSSNNQPANNKQLMRLMDSLKRLGDENAALLREVEQAETARAEAKAARQEMRRFKQEFTKRFEAVKVMLKKYEGGDMNSRSNLLLTSEYLVAASASEQIARQENLIRQLKADLKKEKEEAKKKEVIFKRYENFYREVKAKSQQKAAQRRQAEATVIST